MSELIKLNKVFEVKKGNKISKWKEIKHPYFDDLTLVKNYCGLYGEMTNGISKEDYKHINGKTTLATAYNDAFKLS